MNEARDGLPSREPEPRAAIRTRGPSRLARSGRTGAVRTRGTVATGPERAGLSDLLDRVREEVEGFSLSWSSSPVERSPSPGHQVLSSLQSDLDRDDVVWGVGRGPRSADYPGVRRYLDLDLEGDRRVSDVLVADLLVCGAGDGCDSGAVDEWRGRSRATVWIGPRPPADKSGLGELLRWL